MLKKITILLIFVLVGLATFLAGYVFSRRLNSSDQQALINNSSLVERFNKTGEKYAEPAGLFSLTSGEASFPTVSGSGADVWYYIPRTGEIKSITVKNPLVGSTLVAKIQPNASYISWGTNKTLLANYSTGSIYYDLGSNFSKKYDPNIKNPVLSKTGDKIAYVYFNKESGDGSVSVADPKLEAYKNILPTRFANWQISWLGNDELALVKPQTLENTQVSLFVLKTGNGEMLQNIINLKNNLEVAWSPDKQRFIYSYADMTSGQTSLFLMNLADKNEVPLNLDFNASRCVWGLDNKTVYCSGKDSFLFFDVTAATETTVIPNSQSADAIYADNLILTPVEDYLIFKNTKDGRLYGLGLNR